MDAPAPLKRIIVGGVVVASGGLIGWITEREGNEHRVYADVGGVPTVCAGVVVRGVAIGTQYNRPQCDELTRTAIERHGRELLACTWGRTGVQLKQHEYDALASLAYNVGTANVCASCLPRSECLGDLIRAGKMAAACERITAYSKVRIRGVLADCRERAHGCYGVWLRRQAERDLCLGRRAPLTAEGRA